MMNKLCMRFFLVVAAALLSNTAWSYSGGILEAEESLLDRSSTGCALSGCHGSTRSVSPVSFLTYSSQANRQSSLNDTTLKLGKIYNLRMFNQDVAPAGFSLGTVGDNGTFTAGANNRAGPTGVNDEITHISSGSDLWEFQWTPSEVGSDSFEWCSQQVDGDGLGTDDAGDGPFDCQTTSFTVEAPVPPVITGEAVQVFLETSTPSSRVIQISVADANTGDDAGLTYLWEPVTGTLQLSSATVVNPLYTGDAQQVYRITATDEFPQTDVELITVDIDPVPVAVVSNAPVAAVTEGTTVSVSGADSSDKATTAGASVAVTEYRWILRDSSPSGAVILSQNGAQAGFSFTAPEIPFDTSQTFTIELTVVDSAGQETSATPINVVFEDVAVSDSAPVILSLVSDGGNEGETVTLSAEVGEPVDAVWTQTAGTPTVSLQGDGLSRTFVVDIADPNLAGPLLEFNLQVTDTAAQSANQRVSVQINNGPTASAGQDAQVSEGATVVLDGSASSDPDGAIDFNWTELTTTGIQLEGATTAMPQFATGSVPPEGLSVSFRLTVTDAGGLQSTDEVDITIDNVNEPPVAAAGSVQNVTEGELVTLNGSGSTDDEPNTLQFSWQQTAGPSVTLSDSSLSMPTFTAPGIGFDTDSVLAFELTVTDAENLQSVASTMVNVSDNNMAPIAEAGEVQNVGEGQQVVLDGTGSTDPDLAVDDVLTFSWVQISGDPLPALQNATTSMPGFTAPLVDAAGLSGTFELTVTDRGGLVDTDQTVVNVVNDNQPPSADAGEDQAAVGGATVVLDGQASQDPDGPITAVSWDQLEGPPTALENPSAVQTSFVAPAGSSEPVRLVWRLTVVGNEGLQDQDDVVVIVARENAVAPVANAGPDQSVETGDRVTLDGAGSSDNDAVELQYAWRQIGAPSVTLENPQSVTPQFVAPDAGDAGLTLVFELSVTDDDGLQTSDRVAVALRRAGDIDPPLAALLPVVRTVEIGDTASAFVAAVNAGEAELTDCSVAPGTAFPGAFSYQTTNSETNALTGSPNTPASIAPGAAQSFVIGLTPSAVFPPTELAFTVDCANTPRARTVTGLSTLLFSATENPTADVVAVAATASGDGVLRVPGVGASAAFGVASSNLGATAILKFEVDAGADLPVEITVCETIPATAACIAPPVRAVNTNAFMNGSASYSVFVTATGPIAFDPENHRIRVRFMDGEDVRGATSLAITTQ